MFRTWRTFVNPFTRTALLAFAWSHRRTIIRWGRSFWNELRRPGRIDPQRLRLIGKVLWAITRDQQLATARRLRHVSLEGSMLRVDAPPGWWGRARLVDEVADIEGVTAVVDTKGRPLHGSIDAELAS